MTLESPASPVPELEPPHDCGRCARLVAYRGTLRSAQPDWWNGPVPVSGDADAWLAIVGLAPGAKGANRTGRAFIGDESGRLLFATLLGHGLASGAYDDAGEGGLRLRGAAIVNAVRCVPPANRPLADEIAACRVYLGPVLARLDSVRVVVALGRIAHEAVVRNSGGRLAAFRFGHLAEHDLPGGRVLIDSYHCSRYNQNTNRLTAEMFDAVFVRALRIRDGGAT
ncbi:MAG: uracil-DNA glycosylase [Alphaproteobacteria bacterium]|nr:uracil-DNA glycosylase [Alphaproteobacteria bacterium]